eukprot:scaffold18419_cov98-Isochrysis_galbana.AAC.2
MRQATEPAAAAAALRREWTSAEASPYWPKARPRTGPKEAKAPATAVVLPCCLRCGLERRGRHRGCGLCGGNRLGRHWRGLGRRCSGWCARGAAVDGTSAVNGGGRTAAKRCAGSVEPGMPALRTSPKIRAAMALWQSASAAPASLARPMACLGVSVRVAHAAGAIAGAGRAATSRRSSRVKSRGLSTQPIDVGGESPQVTLPPWT